ncbi:MAG: NAD-binding protein [Gemmatimonadota bacterium]|jgi:voltage-gated potassium channel Kch
MDTSIATPAPGTRSLRRPFVWRGLAFALVYLMGVAGLSSGVGVSGLNLAESGIAARAYYALGLFVLGGLDIGTPMGGPLYGRVLLWTAYFVAPIITASALIEAAARLIGPLSLRLRPLNGHVVIAGAGRLSRLYIRKLRDRDTRRTIVLVERNSSHPSLAELHDLYRVLIVAGDIRSDDVLRGLRLERARRVLLLTNDDFANLDAAARIMKLAPDIGSRTVVHVSDLGFLRETAESSVARVCETFNGHEFAAMNLVREHLLRRFHSTPHRDLVILAGFGRFGQTVLHQLQQHALGSFGHVVIIDEDAAMNARVFDEEPGFADDYERAVVDGDLLDPELWRRIGDVVRAHGHDPVVVMGSGNDGTNLHAALMVRKRHPGAYVIVRTFGASPFTAEIAQETGVQAFNLRELVGAAMPETWF